MASYQRVALYVLFDAMERDLVQRIRLLQSSKAEPLLTHDERQKATARLQRRDSPFAISDDEQDLLHGLDLGDKLAVVLRNKTALDQSAREYYQGKRQWLERAIPIRNSVMHGRPLTTDDYATAFALANDLLKSPAYWPELSLTYRKYASDPESFVTTSLSFLEDEKIGEALNNLPLPDYDDTGFLPRPALEKELKKRLLGRHPIITVLGEGGNGKTALALQTLYGLL